MKTCAVCQVPNAGDGIHCRSCGSLLLDDAGISGHANDATYEVLSPGTTLQGGALAIDGFLGQGGFGITYGGFDALSGERVAIKEFFPYGCLRRGSNVAPSHLLDADQFALAKANFLHETSLAIRFRHPNIVEVRAVFEENNTAYLVMEFLDGPTLQELIEKHGALSQAEAVRYIEQIGQAIETLHAVNLLHRDIKPENIIICGGLGFNPAPRAVLLDFGSAREFAGGTTKHMTSVLTPGYAPLEQYGQRARFGRFTDIYALGATLYHLLTGNAPPQATDRASGIDIVPPGQLNPYIDHIVSDAVLWAMEIKVDARPQTVEEWIRALHTGRPRGVIETSKLPETVPDPVKVLSGPNLQPLDAPDELPVAAQSTLDPSDPELSWRDRLQNGSAPVAADALPKGERLPRQDRLVTDETTDARWYEVTVTARRLKWPQLCACCHLPCTTSMRLQSKTATWEVPYCPPCREHAERGHSFYGFIEGVAISLAALGAVMALAFEQWRTGVTIGLTLPLLLLLGSELAGRGLLHWLRQSRGNDCCEYRPAVRYLGRRGDEFRWRFRSRRFAQAFCDLNVPVDVATKVNLEPETSNQTASPHANNVEADKAEADKAASKTSRSQHETRHEKATRRGIPLS